MPKLVTKKNIKVIKIHVSRMVKSFKFIVKTMVFESLTSCVREQKMYQNSIQMDTKSMLKLMKIEADIMFEKVMQVIQKTIQRRVQLNTKNFQKAFKNRRWKTAAKGSGKEHPGQFLDSNIGPSRGGGGGDGGHVIIYYTILTKLAYIILNYYIKLIN